MLFTNFSKFEVQTDDGEQSYDDEEEESKTQAPQEVRSKDEGTGFGFDSLVDQFKKDLLVQIMEDQSMNR